MKKIACIMHLLIFLILLISSKANADEIKIIAANLPPMFMSPTEGREQEIIARTLEQCGYTAIFEIQPFTRHWKSYEAGEGDAVTTVPPDMKLSGTQTDIYIRYQNGSSYLEKSFKRKMESLSDLKGLRVLAFRKAHTILPGLADKIPLMEKYGEVTRQIEQSKKLFSGKIDIVIADGLIFAEYNRQLRNKTDQLDFNPDQHVKFKAIFKPSTFTLNFRNPKHAIEFDRCFKIVKNNGTIYKINKKWVDRYRATLGNSYLNY